jgi:hypothetical protein
MYVYGAPNTHNGEGEGSPLLKYPSEISKRNLLVNSMILDLAWLDVPQSPGSNSM